MAGRKRIDFDAKTVEWFYKRGATREEVEDKSDFYFALRWILNHCKTDERTGTYYFFPSELRKCGRFKHEKFDSLRVDVLLKMLELLNVITGSVEIPSGGRPRFAHRISPSCMRPKFMKMPSSHEAWLELIFEKELMLEECATSCQ